MPILYEYPFSPSVESVLSEGPSARQRSCVLVIHGRIRHPSGPVPHWPEAPPDPQEEGLRPEDPRGPVLLDQEGNDPREPS